MPPTLGLYFTLKVLPQERMAWYMEGFLIWRSLSQKVPLLLLLKLQISLLKFYDIYTLSKGMKVERF
jgi:hypothetical protein